MKKLFIALVALSLLTNCTPEANEVDLTAIGAPENISALMTIAQDNSGKVSITPRGQGVTQYEVYFGDATVLPVVVAPGQSVIHTYSEGVFQVRIVGTTLNGKRTEVTQELTVTFVTPTNLQSTVTPVAGDNMSVSVSATANLETFFQVYFGDAVDEVPVSFNEGETITHTYATQGTYTVKVRALSGGSAYAEQTHEVVISNPILLPIDFESTSLDYAFVNFGNANASVVANPFVNAGNGSAKVGKLTKNAGADTWAGSYLEVGNPIDFSVMKKIKMKVYSPQAGIVIKMKVENATDATIFKESDVTLTTANSWQELTFDFTGINTANTYQKIVVFFNFGNPGVGLSYYFDDIQQSSGAEALGLPLTFQSSTLNYAFVDFGSATTTVVNNPQTNGINTSTKVGKFDKVNGAQTWAGSSILMDGPINFAVQKKLKMKVWSPAVGKTVKLKLEILNAGNPDPTNIERDATTTVANAWEELTFDFNGINNANNYRRVVLFFDFGSTAASTFYFDDIIQAN